MKRALVLVAHGSRRESSNEEVRRLAAELAGEAGGHFELVIAAFLELAEPLIPDGIRTCLACGVEEVVVLPYFLTAGRHVVEDIPAEVAKVDGKGAVIRIAPYLGSAVGLGTTLLALAQVD